MTLARAGKKIPPLSPEDLIDINDQLMVEGHIFFKDIQQQFRVANKALVMLRKQLLSCVTCILVQHKGLWVLVFCAADQELFSRRGCN